MTGIIVLNKPSGITSFGAVARIRRLTGEKRCGHGGTLDPEASGLLPVLVGKATRLSDCFLTFPKTYRAELTLGLTSDTGDIWGNIERTDGEMAGNITRGEGECGENISRSVREILGNISREQLISVLPEFTGTVMQLPPAYSALKIGGVAAYKLARKGQTPELKPRPVQIYSIEAGAFKNDYATTGELPVAEITVRCGRGTYIRTLCEDIGARLGTRAVMSKLTRLSYGRYSLEEAAGLESLEAVCEGAAEPDARQRRLIEAGLVRPCDDILGEYPEVRLDAAAVRKYLNGVNVEIGRFVSEDFSGQEEPGECRVYSPDGALLGLGSITSGGFLRSRINLTE